MADGQHAAKKSKAKGRKIGRNLVKCQAYRMRGQREKNRALRHARHRRRLARFRARNECARNELARNERARAAR